MPRKYIKGTATHRFWSYVNSSSDCWEWTGARDRWGYGSFKSDPGWGTTDLAHRFAYELFFGPIPSGLHVCHTCDNPACVRPDHLFLGSGTHNERDKIAKGRKHSQAAANNSQARLTADAVQTIRAASDAGESRHMLATRYHVSPDTIADIVMFRSWRSLDPAGAARFAGKPRDRGNR